MEVEGFEAGAVVDVFDIQVGRAAFLGGRIESAVGDGFDDVVIGNHIYTGMNPPTILIHVRVISFAVALSNFNCALNGPIPIAGANV